MNGKWAKKSCDEFLLARKPWEFFRNMKSCDEFPRARKQWEFFRNKTYGGQVEVLSLVDKRTEADDHRRKPKKEDGNPS